MANVIKRLVQAIFQDYSFYHIYGHECTGEISAPHMQLRFQPIGQNPIFNSEDDIIAHQAWYYGDYSARTLV